MKLRIEKLIIENLETKISANEILLSWRRIKLIKLKLCEIMFEMYENL